MAVSVRRSVVIWYTVWMIVLILIVMAVVLSGGWYIADRQAGRILARMVDDAADEVEFDDGRIEVDDDAVLRGNGVFIGVYGSNGQRIAGYIPEDSPFPDFSDGTMRQENGWLVIEVKDTGRGLDRHELENVLRPFYTTKEEGTGLGLPIADAAARAHGGSLSLSSEAGKGTAALLSLPLLPGSDEQKPHKEA